MARYKNGFDGMMPRTFNQLLDTMVNEATGGRSAQVPFALRVDAWETPEAFEIQAAVPGFAKEDISVELNDGKLTISGERKFERKENYKYLILESSFGRFIRSFNLPENVNSDRILAGFENGMLKITLPKDEQKILRRKIEISDSVASPVTLVQNPETDTKNTSDNDTEKPENAAKK